MVFMPVTKDNYALVSSSLQFLIVVVDSTDRERLAVTKAELYNMLNHEVRLYCLLCIVFFENLSLILLITVIIIIIIIIIIVNNGNRECTASKQKHNLMFLWSTYYSKAHTSCI